MPAHKQEFRKIIYFGLEHIFVCLFRYILYIYVYMSVCVLFTWPMRIFPISFCGLFLTTCSSRWKSSWWQQLPACTQQRMRTLYPVCHWPTGRGNEGRLVGMREEKRRMVGLERGWFSVSVIYLLVSFVYILDVPFWIMDDYLGH